MSVCCCSWCDVDVFWFVCNSCFVSWVVEVMCAVGDGVRSVWSVCNAHFGELVVRYFMTLFEYVG